MVIGELFFEELEFVKERGIFDFVLLAELFFLIIVLFFELFFDFGELFFSDDFLLFAYFSYLLL